MSFDHSALKSVCVTPVPSVILTLAGFDKVLFNNKKRWSPVTKNSKVMAATSQEVFYLHHVS